MYKVCMENFLLDLYFASEMRNAGVLCTIGLESNFRPFRLWAVVSSTGTLAQPGTMNTRSQRRALSFLTVIK